MESELSDTGVPELHLVLGVGCAGFLIALPGDSSALGALGL